MSCVVDFFLTDYLEFHKSSKNLVFIVEKILYDLLKKYIIANYNCQIIFSRSEEINVNFTCLDFIWIENLVF